MSKRGILWRVLGDDPERWQSAEAWSVVADLCEQEGYEERAGRLREAVGASAPGPVTKLLWFAQAWHDGAQPMVVDSCGKWWVYIWGMLQSSGIEWREVQWRAVGKSGARVLF